MFVHPADLARAVAPRRAVSGSTRTVDKVRWTDIRDRVFGRIDPISAGGRAVPRRAGAATSRVYEGHARFTGPRELHVPTGPDVALTRRPDRHRRRQPAHRARGRRGVGRALPHLRHGDADRRRCPSTWSSSVPGYIAAEFAHVFSAFGCRGLGRRAQQPDAARAGRDHHRAVHRAGPRPVGRAPGRRARAGPRRRRRGGVQLDLADGTVVRGDLLLVATGRQPERRPARPGRRRHPDPRRTAGSSSTSTSARRRTACSRSGTSARRSSSSTWPTTRRGSWRTTCCTPTRRSRRTTGSCRRRCSPSRRSPRSGAPSRSAGPAAWTTRCTCRPTATSPTAGRWRTTPASARCSPSAAPGGCSARTSWAPHASMVIQPLIQAMSFGLTATRDGERAVLDPPGPARAGGERAARAAPVADRS